MMWLPYYIFLSALHSLETGTYCVKKNKQLTEKLKKSVFLGDFFIDLHGFLMQVDIQHIAGFPFDKEIETAVN